MTGIYKIVNLVNNKVYIGQAVNIESRWFAHRSMLLNNNHHSLHLQNAWNKYGQENFKFEVIEECSEDNLTQREQCWIDYYGGINSNNNYNGRDAGNKGKPSKETRIKMCQNHADFSGKNNPMYGTLGGMYRKKHSEKYKQYMKQRFSGKNNPMYGKKLSEEHKKAIIRANTGRVKSEEEINKLKSKISGDNSIHARKIGKFDLDNNLIKVYNSLISASKECNLSVGVIGYYCRNFNKSKNGFKWRYLEPSKQKTWKHKENYDYAE